MNVVAPMWAWRTFGDRFTHVETLVAAAAPRFQLTQDTYIVCNGSDVNTTIRDAQLEVMVRLQAAHGLELWSRALRARFPIGAGVIRRLFAEWGLLSPALGRDEYTQREFLSEVIALTPQCHIIDVEKQHRGTALFGCAVEAATLKAGDRQFSTVAVEAAEPDDVLGALSALALSDRENLNYVKALKRLTGGLL
jgi:hypothetical protein